MVEMDEATENAILHEAALISQREMPMTYTPWIARVISEAALAGGQVVLDMQARGDQS